MSCNRRGKKGHVENNNSLERAFLEVLATEGVTPGGAQGNKDILLKFKVGHILKDGSRKIISNPSVLAMAGKEAPITVGDDNQSDRMTLKVIASRK